MSSAIGYIYVTGGGLVLTLKGHPYNVHPQHQNIEEIWRLLEKEPDMPDEEKEEKLLALLKTTSERILEAAEGFRPYGIEDVEIDHGVVVIQGEEVHNLITEKILELAEVGRDYSPLVAFMANLSHNPSERSREQLFGFLEQAGLPLTPDGCFLSYKGVKHDFWDKHTGKTFQYLPGKVIEMPREQVCDDPNQACASGIHVGTLDYAKGFATIQILLKVNPADAVSVPTHERSKLRVCRAEVVRVYEGDKVLARPVYTDEEIQHDHLLQADEDYRRLSEDGVVVKAKTFEELFKEYSEMNRDDVCREAARQGFFISTNEARDMGKEFVVTTLANRGLPLKDGRRDLLAKLAVRRGLFTSEKSALRKGRPTIIERLQEDVEQRLLLLEVDEDAAV